MLSIFNIFRKKKLKVGAKVVLLGNKDYEGVIAGVKEDGCLIQWDKYKTGDIHKYAFDAFKLI